MVGPGTGVAPFRAFVEHHAVGSYRRQQAVVVIGIGVGGVEAAGVGSGYAVRSAKRLSPRRWWHS